MKDELPNVIFDFSESCTWATCKIADRNRSQDITVVICDRKVTISDNDGVTVVDAIYCGIIIGGGRGEIIKGFIDFHHQPILFLGMDIEQLERLLTMFQQEQTGEFRLVYPFVFHSNGSRKCFPFFDAEYYDDTYNELLTQSENVYITVGETNG